MSPLQDHEILFFLHIPKTAGTTLVDVLAKQFPPQQILQVADMGYESVQGFLQQVQHVVMDRSDYEVAKQLADQTLGRFQLIRGHVCYGPPAFNHFQAVYMTMLRNPLERVFSLYQHVSVHADNPLHATAKDLSFDQFIRTPDFHTHISNQMTSYILGRRPTSVGDMEEACQHLDQMRFVGITEFFAHSMALLHYTFGWEYEGEMKHLNRSVKKVERSTLAPDTFDLIRQFNEFDIPLYEYGVTLFNQRCRQMAADLFAERNQLRREVAALSAKKEQLNETLLNQIRMRTRVYHYLDTFKLNDELP